MKLPLEDPAIRQRLNFHLRLRRITSHLQDHLGENVSLGDAANIACMEKTAFSKFFHHAVGLTFHEFILAWRIQNAVAMMGLSDNSISEIAYQAGFQNLVTFERAFRRFCGCTPSKYRRRLLREKHIVV